MNRTTTTYTAILALAMYANASAQAPLGDTVFATGFQTTGNTYVRSTPNPCLMATGASNCTATVSWSSSFSDAILWTTNPITGDTSIVGSSGYTGTISPNWIPFWPGLNFDIRKADGDLIATGKNVYGQSATVTASRGGSNYNWYNVNATANGEGNPFPYAIVPHYHQAGVRPQVLSQLQQMRNNGQQKLRLMIFHCRVCNGSETYLESSRKTDANGEYFLPRQAQTNLANFLADIRTKGFDQVILVGGPGHLNDLHATCADPNINMTPAEIASYAYDNLGVIKELRAAAVQSSIDYLIDLSNEQTPNPTSPTCHINYIRDMWSNYVSLFGTAKTIGYSVPMLGPWDAYYRFGMIEQVYGSNPPSVFDFHIYVDGSGNGRTALRAAAEVQKNLLPPSYRNIPWIIGESHYNSATAAADLGLGTRDVGNKVQALFQWSGYMNSSGVFENVIPLAYSAYQNAGF